MVLSLNEQQRQNCFLHLRSFLEPLMADAESFYIQLGRVIDRLRCREHIYIVNQLIQFSFRN